MDVRALPIIALLAALAACGGQSPSEVDAARPDAPKMPADVTEPVPADTRPLAPSGATRALPIASDAIAYFGLAAAPFGSDEKMLRSAWNGELTRQGPDQAGGCHYLYPATAGAAAAQAPIGFMFEGGRLVRIDVDDPALVAPGGGRIGMSTHEIASRYAERAEVQPHEYVDGAQYLRVPDAGGSGQVLLFETDAERRVIRWRIGVPPQIDYAEGCS